jgi:membrane-associated phospholipid phosphatase
MLVDSRRGLLVSGCLLVGAAVVTLLYVLPATRPEVQAMDDAVWRFARSVENPPATAVAMVLSLLGSGAVNWPLRILAMLLLAWRRHWLRLAAFALAVITSELLIGWMKAAVDRPRPPDSLIATTGAAFPSGHAIATAVIFTSVMALSRVYLRAHWLTDTVAGALLGAGLALGWPALLMALRHRRDPVAPAS